MQTFRLARQLLLLLLLLFEFTYAFLEVGPSSRVLLSFPIQDELSSAPDGFVLNDQTWANHPLDTADHC